MRYDLHFLQRCQAVKMTFRGGLRRARREIMKDNRIMTPELQAMPAPLERSSSTALVHEGWDHLKRQRPLAAWASWQRALRADPECAAAIQALGALGSTRDLPLAARASYRLREPRDLKRRTAWDARIAERPSEDLAASADVFGRLAMDDPLDSAAWYNRALCLAWQGENREAISCLDRVVGLDSESSFDQATAAWVLAEVLRQGGGAEDLADDLRFACTIAWTAADTAWLLDEFPEIEHVPTPREPGAAGDLAHEVAVFEWLDRREPTLGLGRSTSAGFRSVLASVYIDRHSLRLSSPRVETLRRAEELLFPRLAEGAQSTRREVTPLPLPFLDADVWTFRTARGVDPGASDELCREAVEHYYENEWIHRKRQGLGNRSPLDASFSAREGDSIARAKLSAVVRLREQLGERPAASRLYQGYPFDRLRRRLGLEPVDPATVDSADLACAPTAELDQLETAVIDDSRLVEAVRSAFGLGEDERTARLSAELIRRDPAQAHGLDPAALVAPLVRLAASRAQFTAALDWIERAKTMAEEETRKKLDIWRAEIYARSDRPKSSRSIYLELIAADPAEAALALDGALTLLDNGHREEGESLLFLARDLARTSGRRWIERRARYLIDRYS
jgi:tetratricopeptide (TPR) repeat protein